MSGTPLSANAGGNHRYHVPPKTFPAFPGLTKAKPKTSVQGGGKLRNRWKDQAGNIFEWDSQHGALEMYNKRGIHLGEFNPETGEQTKPADGARRVEP
ncbi:colicin E3 [Pseudomonas sp. PIC25]|nr:colicin E3 [Pseudomonas sp. PIC25]